MSAIDNIPEFTDETFNSNETLTSDIKKKTTEELADQIINALFGEQKEEDQDQIKDNVIPTSHKNIVLVKPRQIIIQNNNYVERGYYGIPKFKKKLKRVE